MYLRKIEAQGFKSFANKTVLEFQPGIMGIVGPNGSGKSNVADAVRWVLGEQSPKSLRGSNMQDVIFAGTESRKPQGYAYVSLTLDNSDHMLPVDFEEVTVTRRVYRSGESEYLINGNACRLRDINEMFYDTGVGKEGYSIIGQGQIDKILSSKPEDRRELFDEAAGIVKLKKRKTITLKKLDDEQQNLLRVSDILNEITNRLEKVSVQAVTAKTYLRLRDELKAYEVGAFVRESEDLTRRLEGVEGKLTIAREDYEASSEQLDADKVRYDKLSAQKDKLDQRIERDRQAQTEAGIARENIEGQISVLNEQISSMKASEEQLNSRLTALEEKHLEYSREKETFVSEKSGLDGRIDGLDDQIAEAEDELLDQDAVIREQERLLDEKQNRLLASVQQKADLSAGGQTLMSRLAQAQERKDAIREALLSADSEADARDRAIEDLAGELEAVRSGLKQSEKKLVSLRENAEKTDAELAKLNRQLSEKQNRYQQVNSRLEAMVNIAERYDGYGDSIKRVMGEKKTNKGILGVVADLIKTEKKYETAIETALGGHIQNVVTEDEATAKKMVEFLKKNRYGRVTFLPLDAVKGSDRTSPAEAALGESGAIGLASSLVEADSKYSGIVDQLLGRVLVADHIDNALKIARKYNHRLNIVTLEGEYMAPGGAITGGAFRNSSNLLGRRREIEELEAKVAAVKAEGEALITAAGKKTAEASALRDNIERERTRQQELQLKEATLTINLEQAKTDRQRIAADRQDKEAEQQSLLLLITELTSKAAENQEAAEKAELAEAESRKENEQLIAGLESERALLKEKTDRVNELKLEFSTLNERNSFLLENIRRINAELASLAAEKDALLSQADPEGVHVAEKIEEIVALRKDADEAAAKYDSLTEKLAGEIAERDGYNAELKRILEDRESNSARTAALDKDIYRLESQAERLKESREAQVEHLWTEYGMTPSEAAKQPYEGKESITEIRRQIAQHKRSIQELGPVNVNAIEEEKELSERHGFLGAQHDDLVKARDNLLRIIDDLDEGMRRQFEEKFAEIKKEFDRVFKDLFGGGTGTLELLRGADGDILESGIAIIAQPPGKKLQNMMQLSGGEKALTAIALIFAIQNLKPSPFCLVDEIEAALDEPNVARFADYLKILKDQTQLIVITHRRGTMESADRLYGITMQEKGVSTLVSVDLADPAYAEEE